MGPKGYCGQMEPGTKVLVRRSTPLLSFISAGLTCPRDLFPTPRARSVQGAWREETKCPRARDRLGAIGDFQFAEDITNMMLHGAGCDHQGVRDVLVRGTTREQAEHVLFTCT